MIVLGTHTWVWWVSNPENLSPPARKIIDSTIENNEIFISSISAWEVALLVAKGRLQLTIEISDWIAKSERLPFVKFIPIDNAIAVKSVSLPKPLHSDPAGRHIAMAGRSVDKKSPHQAKRFPMRALYKTSRRLKSISLSYHICTETFEKCFPL
jgi:PIN domain nuclease of toxin-antitoxin system